MFRAFSERNMAAKNLIDLLEAKGFLPTAYAGRGCFGRHCVSVQLECIEDVAMLGPECREGLRLDSLAMQYVAYWHDVPMSRE